MNRKLIGSVVAIVLAAVGTFILLMYVRSAEDRALAGEQVTPVYVVRQLVPKGTRAEDLPKHVELEKVPAKVFAAGGVSDLADLQDKVAAVDLVPGEQVVQARFQSPEEVAAAGAIDVPEGLQEVTVSLTADRAAGGRVQPGDTVGVVASFEPFETSGAQGDGESGPEGDKTPNTTHMILHKVLVTDIAGGAPTAPQGEQQEDAAQTQKKGAPGETYLVTLAVEANAVEKLVFTAEFGTLWLSNENEDAAEEPTQIETRGTVYE